MKLLIIEENPDMRRLIRSLVAGLPLVVSECEDGAQALQVCAAVQPDWVLIDLNLAATDGLVATRQISAAHPQARVMVVTDDDGARLLAAAQAAGACGYVLKENLLDVRRLLQTRD